MSLMDPAGNADSPYTPKNKDTFKKDDLGKPRVSLIEKEFILGTAEVLTLGAQKYGVANWKLGSSPEDISRYKDALLRHVLAYTSGEVLDPETRLSHAYHAACNLMFLDHFERNKPTH